MKKFLILIAILVSLAFASCSDTEAVSVGGVKIAHSDVKTQENGLTIEQQNVQDRLNMENKPGGIQHLYIISAYTGQVLIYSTVKGKVTSSNKRLTPPDIYASGDANTNNGFRVDINGHPFYTKYVLGDDGTYGSSMEYLFWWDVNGNYHQQYISGGVTVTISDKPLAIKALIYDVEVKK